MFSEARYKNMVAELCKEFKSNGYLFMNVVLEGFSRYRERKDLLFSHN